MDWIKEKIKASRSRDSRFAPASTGKLLRKTPLAPLYDKLDLSRKEIRLVELECWDGNVSKPIRCSLIKSNMDNNDSPYEALSYVWGDSRDTVPLTINGHTLHITRNLDNALRNLRQTKNLKAAASASSDPVSLALDHAIGTSTFRIPFCLILYSRRS